MSILIIVCICLKFYFGRVGSCHTETSQLFCCAIWLTGFHMKGTFTLICYLWLATIMWNEIYLKSNPLEVFYKKGVLKKFAKFTGGHLCQSLFFDKVAGLRPAILLKKILGHWHFSVIFAKFLITAFFIEHLFVAASVAFWIKIYIRCSFWNFRHLQKSII